MGSFPETEIGHSSDLKGYQIDNKVLFIYSHISNRNNVKMLVGQFEAEIRLSAMF